MEIVCEISRFGERAVERVDISFAPVPRRQECRITGHRVRDGTALVLRHDIPIPGSANMLLAHLRKTRGRLWREAFPFALPCGARVAWSVRYHHRSLAMTSATRCLPQIYAFRLPHITSFQLSRRGERPRCIHDEQHDLVEIDGAGAEHLHRRVCTVPIHRLASIGMAHPGRRPLT